MVNRVKALKVEQDIMRILNNSSKLKKYKLELHSDSPYGIDIQSTSDKYPGFAIEVESTEQNWPEDAPYPPSWKNGFTVPSRKRKFSSRPLESA